MSRHLCLTLAALAAGAALSPATALAADGVRVLTYNTAFLYLEAENPHVAPVLPLCISCDPLMLPPLSPLGGPCECFPSMVLYPNEGRFTDLDEVARADAIADRILATDQEVVVLNEVFNPDVRERLTERLAVTGPYVNYISRLRGHPVVEGLTLSDLVQDEVPWLPDLPEFLDYEAVPGDSGLMIFSKLPFQKLTGSAVPDDTACAEEVCEVRGWNNGAPIAPGDFAFEVYEACEDPDCWASKGVGLVKVGTPRISTYVAFTHMQADYPDEGLLLPDVREKQFQAIRDTIIGSIDARDIADAFVVLAGDLNVVGSEQSSAQDPETQEWHDVFDPGSVNPNAATGFFACGNGVQVGPSVQACRFGVNGSSMLSDPRGFRHSETDPGITNDEDDARLDYLAHSPAGGRMCPQHIHIAWDLLAEVDGGKAWLSDHLPLRGDFAVSGTACSPSDDPQLFNPAQNARMLQFGATNCAPSGPNPPCHQDEIVAPPTALIAMGGNMQWFVIDQPGSYSIRTTPSAANAEVDFLVYHHTDLSRPLQPFDPEETEWGLPFALPDPPYYIRTFAVDGTGQPDRNATNREYTLTVHQHLCRDPQDACFLAPGFALTAPSEYVWPTTVDVLSEVRDTYWKFKTSGVAGGDLVTDANAGVLHPRVDFMLEAAKYGPYDCITEKEPLLEDWDDPTFPSVLLEEIGFVDVLVEPQNDSWDGDAILDERWVAPDLAGKTDGELATYFVHLTRNADHTDPFNTCNAGMTSTIAYDTDLTFVAPLKLKMWAELDDDLGAEDNLLVHSGFDANGYTEYPSSGSSASIAIEELSDGPAIRWLTGRPELRGYYVQSMWPTLWEEDEEELITAWEPYAPFTGLGTLHPFFTGDDDPFFHQYSDGPNGDEADYYYYYWAHTCHLETETACYDH